VGLTGSLEDYYSDGDDSYQMSAEISYAGVNPFLARNLCVPLSYISLSILEPHINSFNPTGPSCYYMGHLRPGEQKTAFCPHSVFMCFMWLLQYTAVSICSCCRSILLLEAHCVPCDVRTEYFNISQIDLAFRSFFLLCSIHLQIYSLKNT
jgi:hypothetical protein